MKASSEIRQPYLCSLQSLVFTTEKMTAAKFPSFKLLYEKLSCKTVIEMCRKGGWGVTGVGGCVCAEWGGWVFVWCDVSRCVFVSLNAYREKSKNLPQNFLLNCCSLLQISPFIPKF